MANSTSQTTEVRIDRIQVEKGRSADPKKVQWLADSIKENGLLQPIGLTSNNGLIFGLHRLEAYKLLKRKSIPATICDLDDLHAELAEIDENLMRRQLDALEMGEALLRRKELYEQLHPETRHGGDRRSKDAKSSGNNCHLIGFAEDAAQKMGKSARLVRAYIKAAEHIPPDLRKQLRKTVVGGKITELTRLSTLPQNDQRTVVKKIVAGAESVVEAIQAIKGKPSSEMLKLLPAGEQVTDGNNAQQAPSGDGATTDSEAGDEASAVKQPRAVPAEKGADRAASPDAECEAEACPAGDHVFDDEQSAVVDPLTVYRDLLQQLPETIELLYEHFDDVVGQAMSPGEAAAVLEAAVDFLQAAHAAESGLAELQPELDLMPCGT